jgi:hypothetical protein
MKNGLLLSLILFVLAISCQAQEATSKVIADAQANVVRTAKAAALQADVALKDTRAVQAALEEAQRKQRLKHLMLPPTQ